MKLEAIGPAGGLPRRRFCLPKGGTKPAELLMLEMILANCQRSLMHSLIHMPRKQVLGYVSFVSSIPMRKAYISQTITEEHRQSKLSCTQTRLKIRVGSDRLDNYR
jgi:hypothetical protein